MVKCHHLTQASMYITGWHKPILQYDTMETMKEACHTQFPSQSYLYCINSSDFKKHVMYKSIHELTVYNVFKNMYTVLSLIVEYIPKISVFFSSIGIYSQMIMKYICI